MRHRLKISVSRKPRSDGVVIYRNVSVRERLLQALLGRRHKLTVLIPGDNIDEILISETGENDNGKNENAGSSEADAEVC
ncbi:MAG: hypothetical protein IKQ27_16025 [Lachnospiraceae bacterium]|nr:hypothetical protein [Lachnospiraceae bacterium]